MSYYYKGKLFYGKNNGIGQSNQGIQSMINNKGQNNPRVHLNAKASLNNTKPVQVKDGNSYANQANRFINSNQQNLKVNNPKLFLNNPQYISIINKVEQMQGRSYITSDHNNNKNYMSQNKDG